jgi:hypothetical protein
MLLHSTRSGKQKDQAAACEVQRAKAGRAFEKWHDHLGREYH